MSSEDRAEEWDKREDETQKAYRAFLVYLALGVDRTFAWAHHLVYRTEIDLDVEVAQVLTGVVTGFDYPPPPRGAIAPGYFTGWTQRFEWTKRAEAWDNHRRREDMKRWADRRHRARGLYVQHMDDLVLTELSLALGFDLRPLARRDDPSAPLQIFEPLHQTQVKAVANALARAGLPELKEIALELSESKDSMSRVKAHLQRIKNGDDGQPASAADLASLYHDAVGGPDEG